MNEMLSTIDRYVNLIKSSIANMTAPDLTLESLTTYILKSLCQDSWPNKYQNNMFFKMLYFIRMNEEFNINPDRINTFINSVLFKDKDISSNIGTFMTTKRMSNKYMTFVQPLVLYTQNKIAKQVIPNRNTSCVTETMIKDIRTAFDSAKNTNMNIHSIFHNSLNDTSSDYDYIKVVYANKTALQTLNKDIGKLINTVETIEPNKLYFSNADITPVNNRNDMAEILLYYMLLFLYQYLFCDITTMMNSLTVYQKDTDTIYSDLIMLNTNVEVMNRYPRIKNRDKEEISKSKHILLYNNFILEKNSQIAEFYYKYKTAYSRLWMMNELKEISYKIIKYDKNANVYKIEYCQFEIDESIYNILLLANLEKKKLFEIVIKKMLANVNKHERRTYINELLKNKTLENEINDTIMSLTHIPNKIEY